MQSCPYFICRFTYFSVDTSNKTQQGLQTVEAMTPSVGFEPTAKGLEIPCSIP